MNPIYLAIDTSDYSEARKMLDTVGDLVGGLKIGLTFWYSNGPAVVRAITTGFDWFADVKIYDIPPQVGGAVRAVAALGPRFISVHVGELKENASEDERRQENSVMAMAHNTVHADAITRQVVRPKLLAVTTLTHLPATPTQIVAKAHRALSCGMDGVISAPLELRHLRDELGVKPILMTPSIRMPGASPDDQYRTATAREAIEWGANYIVVGRPITKAASPRDAAKAMLDSLP